jgi:hypothetical protein
MMLFPRDEQPQDLYELDQFLSGGVPMGALVRDQSAKDAWKQHDDAALKRQIVPDTGMAYGTTTPQEAMYTEKETADAMRDWYVPNTTWGGGMQAAGAAALSNLHPLAKMGALAAGFALNPSEAFADKFKAAGSGARAGVKIPNFVMGETASQTPALSRSGGWATPEEITKAAAESRQGATQPELRKLYDRLGLTGGAPSELVSPSLAAQHSSGARQAAIDLKLADREVLNTLPKKDRIEYATSGKLPGGALLPSQEVARPGLEAFEPLKKEVSAAEKEFDANVKRGIKPSIFDLSAETLRKTPDVAQFPLPRVAPKQTERLLPVSRGGVQRLERAAANAPEENWGWYNLMQARDLAHKIHGPEKGEQVFNGWLDGVAGTSMVNPIDNNVRSSTWYLQQIMQGKPLPEVLHIVDPETGKMVKTMVGGPPPGYGAKSQIQHADRVKEYLTHTYDPVSNPKPISYRMNLGGNWMPRTVDTHDIRNMVGMPRAKESFNAEDSALLPGEYSYLEGVGQRAATRAGAPQAGQQAATWVGGGIPSPQFPQKGGYTNLKSYPAPLMEVINRRAHVTGMVRGQTPYEALVDAFTGKNPLLGYGAAAVLGGSATAKMGGLADESTYRQ